MTTAKQLLQQYTFEPVTTSTKFEQRALTIAHQDRAIPFGHFKIRLKNIDNQRTYDLELKQRLQLTANGLQLRSRLHGVHVQHNNGHQVPSYQLLASLIVKDAPKGSTTKHDKTTISCLVPIDHHVAKTLPDQVPVYAFTDNHDIALNQTALAKLFLRCIGGDQLAIAS